MQHITFVSNQPYVDYQKSIIAEVFKKLGDDVQFEVIGYAYADLENDTTSKIMQALGSRIWAATPGVIRAIGLDVSDPELLGGFKELYGKQPLIYNNLVNSKEIKESKESKEPKEATFRNTPGLD